MPKRPKIPFLLPTGSGPPVPHSADDDRGLGWTRLVLGPEESFTGFAAAQRCLDYHCHYVSKTYVPCLYDFDADCPYHASNTDPRCVYQGALPLVHPVTKLIKLWMPTAACLRRSPWLLERNDLFGRKITATRARGGCNAMMSSSLAEQAPQRWNPEAAFDRNAVWSELLRIWCVQPLYVEMVKIGEKRESVV